jgi:hypothetical protein
MAFVMDITGIGTLAESALGAYDRWNAYRKESKDANIELEYYRKAVLLEMNKNLQILNRIKDDFDYKNYDSVEAILKTLDFYNLELVGYNLKTSSYFYSATPEQEENEIDGEAKTLYEHIVYIITRIYLLRAYRNFKDIEGMQKLNIRILIKRIIKSMIKISDTLKEEK